jgi:hypothetical protein
MKRYILNKIRITGVILLCVILSNSCDDSFLDEVPKGFLSPENTFVDFEGFETGINDLYRISRVYATTDRLPGMVDAELDKSSTVLYSSGTDFGWYWNKVQYYSDYATVNSFNSTARDYWILSYTLVKGANVVITRAHSDAVKWRNEAEKLYVLAHGRFFRALAYRYLVHLYGDVPIIEAEISRPKIDFVRNDKSEVINFIIDDLEFARNNLPAANSRNGKLSKAAADHLLAEIYITKGDYNKAIETASRVINDPQYQLMTNRFGTMTDKPGDVFSDLFRLGNQNHSANREVIWAWQIEFNVPGGGSNQNERIWGPILEQLNTPDGRIALLRDTYLGRPIGFIRPSVYLEYLIWQSDWDNDIRNSEYNMKRRFYINNPASAHYGELINPRPADTVRRHFVWIQKAAHPHGHPQGYDTGGRLYSDIYAMRLAETYLLRAEAHLRNGDKSNAAADINVVRNRANATPVTADKVDIHYLLDERARELVVEEPRRLTLARMGLLYERVQMYNPVSAPNIREFHNLLPIPQVEIDANVGAELKQNAGY